jgi:hypothetical protein
VKRGPKSDSHNLSTRSKSVRELGVEGSGVVGVVGRVLVVGAGVVCGGAARGTRLLRVAVLGELRVLVVAGVGARRTTPANTRPQPTQGEGERVTLRA